MVESERPFAGQILLSIVVPVYNEAKNIGSMLEGLVHTLRVSHEILIVHDFERDTTLNAIAELPRALVAHVKCLLNVRQAGPLGAIRTGMDSARGVYVAVMMADLSDDPATLTRMLTCANEQGADVVCASRYMEGGSFRGAPSLKVSLSRLAGKSLRFLVDLPTQDATNNYKMYRADWLKSVEIESKAGFEIGLELVLKAHMEGRVVVEVPTHWEGRVHGTSRFRIARWLPHYLRWYVWGIVHALCRQPASADLR